MKPTPPFSLVVLSDHLYRRLLILYPPRFRQEYGREMTLVFRSQCRTLIQTYGKAALAQLWLSTLTDLLATALTERAKEGFAMSKVMWVQLSGILAFIGGLLGLYLLTEGTNEYGNYGWHSTLTPVAILLLTTGFVGWFSVYYEHLDSRGRVGFAIALVGFLSMAAGYLVEALWFLIFIGPALLVPIGAILLGLSTTRILPLPTWWRYFPFAVAAIGLLAFGIEMWEGVVQDPVPDRGIMMAQLLFSVVWLGLGIGLWLTPGRSTSRPGAI